MPQHLLRWFITATIFDSVSLGALFLNAKGHNRMASFVFVGMFITILFGLAWFGGGGIKAGSIRFLPFVVVIAGLLLGKNGGYVIGMLAVLVGLSFVLADYLGILPVSIMIHNPLNIWTISSMCISLFIFFQSINIGNLNKALRDAKHELELRIKSESHLKLIEKNFTAGMIYQLIVEPNGTRKFTYLSDSVRQLYGISPEEGLADGNLIYDRVYDDDKVVLAKAEDEALKTLSTLKVEVRIKNPSEELRWSSLVSTPMLIENGLIRWDGLEVVITGRKHAEDALKEAEERLRFAMETSHIGAWDLDLVDHSAFRSLEHDRIFGYRDLLPHWTYEIFIDHVITQDRLMVDSKFRHATEIKGDWNFECRIRRTDGEIRWIWAAGRYVTEGAGAGRRIAGIVQDITERKRVEIALQANEKKYRSLFETANDAIFLMDGDRFVECNPKALRMFDVTREQIIGMSPDRFSPPFQPDGSNSRVKAIEKISRALDGEPQVFEWRHCQYDGRPFDVEVSLTRVAYLDRIQLLAIVHDITERKQAEMALQEREEWYRTIIHTTMDGFWLTDLKGKLLAVNESYCRMSGYSEQELLDMHISNIDAVESSGDTEVRISKIVELGKVHFESRHRRKDGTLFDVDISVKYLPARGGRLASFLRDITVRKEYEENLKSSLREKEALLQELYHRTKNNMMVISTLLELQAAISDSQETNRIVNDSVFRIRTMALAHEKLYKAQNLSRINMKEYVSELAHLLETGFSTSLQKIDIKLDIEELSLLIDIAIPCGLIINELLSNCFKYAFPAGREGRIDLSLHRISSNEIELQIRDNGIGIAHSTDITKTSTLGVQLVLRIVKSQLRGSSSVENENGLKWRIRFRDDLYSERV
jgi:PAS domain S-box-containing protein